MPAEDDELERGRDDGDQHPPPRAHPSKAQTGTLATSSNPLTIGGDPIYGQYFTGRIDEVRVYTSALTAAQVQADMNTAIP
jgi:Concanavalin A-like lectin/glucanases superfamily